MQLLKAVLPRSFVPGNNLRICWPTPAVKKAIKLKKEEFQDWLTRSSHEGVDEYQEENEEAKRAAEFPVVDAEI